jgi:magnesium chelatase subunit D
LPPNWTSTIDDVSLNKARQRLANVEVPDRCIEAMVSACDRLGISDLRVLDFACASMRGIAALSGASCVEDEHAQLAASLVLGPRVLMVSDTEESEPPPPPEAEQKDTGGDDQPMDDLAEIMISAARYTAHIDADVKRQKIRRRIKGEVASGKSGDMIDSWQRGSRIDARAGDPRRQGRLDLIATLRAAAPWQKIRPRREGGATISIRAADFRLKRFRHRSEAVVIFAVDASGSAAMNRLAEAKGAIEFLLGGCYARRESVAVLAFRRQSAEVLLPPTRSLTRVKRSLAGLPGGGGTPLAAGISAAQLLSEQEVRRRRSPYIVFLSDGQANVGLDGAGGREGASADANRMARRLKGAHLPILFLDTSRRPNADARRLSEEMGAFYRPLPFADGKSVSDTVRNVLLG